MTDTLPAGNEPILLAFSGGLDTSFLVPWLKENYGRPIVTVTVDTGGIDAEAAKVLEQRAKELGAKDHILVEAKKGYFEQVIKYLIIGNVKRGQMYPLCVGAERVMHALMDSAIDAYFPLLDEIDHFIDEVEDRVLGRLVSALEGGYAPEPVARASVAHMRALAELASFGA